MPLLGLPNELLSDIIKLLDWEGDIYAVARSNRRLFDLSIDHLYRFNEDEFNDRAICWAVWNKRDDTLRRALAVGAVIDWDVIEIAASQGSTKLLEFLLNHPTVETDLLKVHGCALLRHAAASVEVDTVRALLEWGAPLTDEDGPVLYHAIWDGCLDIVKLLLTWGADANASAPPQFFHNFSSLICAVNSDYFEISSLLLDNGANVDAVCSEGQTALHYAAKNDSMGIINLLLDHGASVNREDLDGQRPLAVAIVSENLPAARVLLERGAENAIGTNPSHLPLNLASTVDMLEIIPTLIQLGADMEGLDNSGNTPLLNAIHSKRTKVAELLLEKGANPELKASCGCTPLHHAARDDCHEIVEILLRAGASPFSQSGRGWMPLHSAANAGSAKSFALLIEHQRGRETIAIPDSTGATVAHFAAESGKREILDLLGAQPGFNVDVKDYIGRTPLFYAARTGKFDTLRWLQDHGADVAARDHYGATATFIAVRNGHLGATETLLGADPSCVGRRDGSNRTLMWWAVTGGSEYLIATLRKRYQRLGLEVEQGDMAAALSKMLFRPDGCWCDVCTRSLQGSVEAQECTVCCGNQFLICNICSLTHGLGCLDKTHDSSVHWKSHGDCRNCN